MLSNSLITTNKNFNIDNGFTQIGDKYQAQSGLIYASGYREFGDLRITEDVATGTAVSFLSGIKVFDSEGVLIIDKRMKKGCYYEREVARKIVLIEILKILKEQNNPNFNYNSAKKIINNRLKKAYYEISYQAISKWAFELGIFK